MDDKEKTQRIISFFRAQYSHDIKTHPNNREREPFRVLISTVLSQRTREENTWEATKELFDEISSPRELLLLDDEKLRKLIKKSGFFRQKSRTLKMISRALLDFYKGKVPSEREDLIKLPGVGPKTADVVLSHSFGSGNIAVDVHVDVCSKRLGLVPEDADYEKTRKILEELTPPKERKLVNLGFVFFGRNICLTAHPKCGICPFSGFCRYYKTR